MDDTSGPSLRDALSEKYDALAAEPAEVVEVPATPEPVVAPAATEAAETPSRARDEAGKFAKASTALKGEKVDTPPTSVEQGKAAGATPPPPAATPVAEVPKIKPPQSWKPPVRELFAKLPPEFAPIIEEADRLDKEYQKIQRESAQARQIASQVRETLTPFEGLARANGMDSLHYAGSVMQTAAALHMGTPQQKASIVAQLIGAYGIDVDAVNAVMQGQAPATPAPQTQPQDVSQLVERVIQQRIGQATETRAAKAWEEFQASAPEFLSDVQEDMREILMVAGQQGRNMTYQQAYDRACKMNDGVVAAMEQRKEAEAAKARVASTQQAKAAASSIRSQPAAAGEAKPANRREALERAWNKMT